MNSNFFCPSNDCGFCLTAPHPYDVLCGSEETKDCIWLKTDFSKYKFKSAKGMKRLFESLAEKLKENPINMKELIEPLAEDIKENPSCES